MFKKIARPTPVFFVKEIPIFNKKLKDKHIIAIFEAIANKKVKCISQNTNSSFFFYCLL